MASETGPRLRLVAINTAKGDGPYWRRMELLLAGLRGLDPDVVLLQEAFCSVEAGANTCDYLAAGLGMEGWYAPARRKLRPFGGGAVQSESGMGLLTHSPLVERWTVDLPTHPDDGERVAQLGVVMADGVAVLLANVHLTHLRDRPALRRMQVETVLRHPQFAADAYAARVLAGDFNTALPDLPALFTDTPQWRVRDAFACASGAADRITCPVNPLWGGGRCIDYVLGLSRVGEAAPQFALPKVVLGESDPAGVYPSDHRGVAATLLPAGA